MNPMGPEDSFSKDAVRSTILQIVFLNLTIGLALSCPTDQANYPPSIRKGGVHQVQRAPRASQPCLPWDSASAWQLQIKPKIQLTSPEQLHDRRIFLSIHLKCLIFYFYCRSLWPSANKWFMQCYWGKIKWIRSKPHQPDTQAITSWASQAFRAPLFLTLGPREDLKTISCYQGIYQSPPTKVWGSLPSKGLANSRWPSLIVVLLVFIHPHLCCALGVPARGGSRCCAEEMLYCRTCPPRSRHWGGRAKACLPGGSGGQSWTQNRVGSRDG